MSSYALTIDGKSVSAPSSFDVVNPATGQPFAQAPDCSRDQLETAMQAAQRAFGPWSRDEAARREALVACADAMAAATAELGELPARSEAVAHGQITGIR